MTESRRQDAPYFKESTGNFGSPVAPKDTKFTYSELKTDYKRHEDQQEDSPYKATSSFHRQIYQQEDSKKKSSHKQPRKDKRSSSSDRKNEPKTDQGLDQIQEEIRKTGDRLREIHLETVGKEPGNLEEERRQLRKRLIDLDYDHKMKCAQLNLYGKDGPVSSSYSTYTSSSRIALIEAELALLRSRRLRDLESDLYLSDYYLDWPYSSYSYSSYLYRPLSSLLYLDSYYSPYYSYRSLWWL